MRKAAIIIFWMMSLLALLGMSLLAGPNEIQATYALQATSTLALPTSTPDGTPQNSVLTDELGEEIELNTVVEGSLDEGQWDVWHFEGDMDQVVTIALNSLKFDAYLELYAPDNPRVPMLFDDDNGYGTNARLDAVLLPKAGIYTIRARSVDDDGEGAYRLYLSEQSTLDPFYADAIPTLYGAIDNGLMDEVEIVYRLEGKTDQLVSVLLGSDQFDPYLTLTDSFGTILGENDDNNRNRDAALTNIQLPEDGTYYIFVSAYRADSTGEYTLEVYDTTDITETFGGEMTIGELVEGHLTPHSYADWRFMADEGDVVSLASITRPFGERFDLFLELYGPDGELVDADDNSGLIFNPALTDLRLPLTGEYRIRISEAAPTIGGDYLISLAPGRAYFAPDGQVGSLTLITDGSGMTPVEMLVADEKIYGLWVVVGVTDVPFTIKLATSGGEASLDDFTVRVFDTDWEAIADSDIGEIVIEELSQFSDEYLVLVELDSRGTRDYQLYFQSGEITQPTPTVIAAKVLK